MRPISLTCVMVGPSCSNAEKREALGALMGRYLKALEDTGAFPALPDEARAPTPQPQAKEWVLFYLAQHHDKLGETGTAKMPLLPIAPEKSSADHRLIRQMLMV